MKIKENKHEHRVSSRTEEKEAEPTTEKQLVPPAFSLHASQTKQPEEEPTEIPKQEKEPQPFSLQSADDDDSDESTGNSSKPNSTPQFALPISVQRKQKENSQPTLPFSVNQKKQKQPKVSTDIQASTFQLNGAAGNKKSGRSEPFKPKGSIQQKSKKSASPFTLQKKEVENQQPAQQITINWIIEDGQLPMVKGQIGKSVFFKQLKQAITNQAEAALSSTGWTAMACPYINKWIAWYAQKPVAELEQEIKKFNINLATITSAEQLIRKIAAKCAQAITTWVQTGKLTGVPMTALEPPAVKEIEDAKKKGVIQQKSETGSHQTDYNDPEQVQEELGEGNSLDGSTKSKMESAFGTSFADVRIHTDSKATDISQKMGARAFAVGKNIAFNQGEYQPGTLKGDALLAHELAHFIQQRNATSSAQVKNNYGALEKDADQAAIGVMARILGKGKDWIKSLGKEAMPRLQSGLSLQRCGNDGPSAAELAALEAKESAEYQTSMTALKLLYSQKKALVTGNPSQKDVKELQQKIDKQLTKLRELGIAVSEQDIMEAAEQDSNLRKLGGKIVYQPTSDLIFGEKMKFNTKLDFLSPSKIHEIDWKYVINGDEIEPLSFEKTKNSLELDERFWTNVNKKKVVKHGFSVKAYVSLGAHGFQEVTISTPTINFKDELPNKPELEVTPRENIVVGTQVKAVVKDWAPNRREYTCRWEQDGQYISGSWGFQFFNPKKKGTFDITLKIYENKSKSYPPKPIFTLDKKVTVSEPEHYADSTLDAMEKRDMPSMAKVQSSIGKSITALEKKVSKAGENSPYYKHQLKAQRDRQQRIKELLPEGDIEDKLPENISESDQSKIYSGPVNAVLVVQQNAAVQPLNMYITLKHNGKQWHAKLLDITTADVYKYDGYGADPITAYVNAFNDWDSDNEYPSGNTVVYRFKAGDFKSNDSFSTSSTKKSLLSFVDGILMIGGLVVAGLLILIPEPGTTLTGIGMVMTAAAVARGGYAIAKNMDLGITASDKRNVLEAIGILTAAFGMGGSALKSIGIKAVRPAVYRMGNAVIMTSLAGDAGTLVVMTNDAYEQIQVIETNPTMDDTQKMNQILRISSHLLLSGAMMIASNKDLFKGGLKGSDFFKSKGKLSAAKSAMANGGDIKLETGTRLDMELELKLAGEPIENLRPSKTSTENGTKTPENTPPKADTTPGYSDKELVERHAQLSWLKETLKPNQIKDLLGKLSTEHLNHLQDVPAIKVKQIVDWIGDIKALKQLAPVLGGTELHWLSAHYTKDGFKNLLKVYGVEGIKQYNAKIKSAASKLPSKRQITFENKIAKQLKDGKIDQAESDQLREYNRVNAGSKLKIEKVIENIRNTELEFNPESGRFIKKGTAKPKGVEFDPDTHIPANQKAAFFHDIPDGVDRNSWKKYMRSKYKGMDNDTFIRGLMKDVPGLDKTVLETIASTGKLDRFNLVRALKNAPTPSNTLKHIKMLNALAIKDVKGVKQVLGDLASGGNNFEGVHFMLDFIQAKSIQPTGFEISLDPSGVRRYDLEVGSGLYEFKSMKLSSFDKSKWGQMEYDIDGIISKRVQWIFDGKKIAGPNRKALMEKIMRYAKESDKLKSRVKQKQFEKALSEMLKFYPE